MRTKIRLGRGLAALLRETDTENADSDETNGTTKIPTEFIRASDRNPRKFFDTSEIETLSLSIKQRGLLQPILVRRILGAQEQYEIVAGERRWRAAQIANLHNVPAIILDVNEVQALEIGLIENVQRANLSPLEEANGYQALITDHRYTQDEVAKLIGKSRSHVANTLRLLQLPEYTKLLIDSGALTAGHGRALITYLNPDKLADTIISEGLNVRDAERLVITAGVKRTNRLHGRKFERPDLHAWEHKLSQRIGTPVRLAMQRNKCELRILFRDFEQLEDIYKRLVTDKPE